MPYYCTVPLCTSMAGKAKNVSFHQFPRDEELAKLWNAILKRGKPYTKYSKVCSLHFKPEDYTITSGGKNKGIWRTLRKDAIPSQKLPSDKPAYHAKRGSGPWVQNNVPQIQAQQLAQAIYMQTMLAMQAAGVTDAIGLQSLCNGQLATVKPELDHPNTSTLEKDIDLDTSHVEQENDPEEANINHDEQDTDCEEPDTNHEEPDNEEFLPQSASYKCDECAKCFKDADVFILHKRSHGGDPDAQSGKENFDLNALKPDMLRSNPILANLLKNIEKQIMVSFSNIENFSTSETKNVYDNDCDNNDLSDNLESNNLVIDENVA